MVTPPCRVAVIGDVGGFVEHLHAAIATLGVTDSVWPDDLIVVQVGDLFGGRDDVAVAELVAPHPESGRWVQLVGNWELEAVSASQVTNAKGRTADLDALHIFREWHRSGLVRRAAAVTSSAGVVGVITHAGISHGFWSADLDADPDGRRVAHRLNTMPLSQVARPGEMFGAVNETAPGPIWSSWAESWSWWETPPFAQVHGHSSPWNSHRRQWWDATPDELKQHATARDGHVTFNANPGMLPFVSIDPGLWDRSALGSLRPLVFRDAVLT